VCPLACYRTSPNMAPVRGDHVGLKWVSSLRIETGRHGGKPTMRKLLALFVVLGAVLGVVGVAWAATPGVSKDEIKIGVTYPDLDAIRAVTDISHGDYKTTYNAVIDDLNKKGGINGRKVVPVFAPINPMRR